MREARNIRLGHLGNALYGGRHGIEHHIAIAVPRVGLHIHNQLTLFLHKLNRLAMFSPASHKRCTRGESE